MSNTVGNLIKSIRQTREKTQHELGRATKITRTRISKIESGGIKPTLEEISAIAHYFESIEIIRAYWLSSPLFDAAVLICNRMGINLTGDLEITARQLGMDIINRSLRIMRLFQEMPGNDIARQEHILLAGQEAQQISNIATALRLLILDIHR